MGSSEGHSTGDNQLVVTILVYRISKNRYDEMKTEVINSVIFSSNICMAKTLICYLCTFVWEIFIVLGGNMEKCGKLLLERSKRSRVH